MLFFSFLKKKVETQVQQQRRFCAILSTCHRYFCSLAQLSTPKCNKKKKEEEEDKKNYS